MFVPKTSASVDPTQSVPPDPTVPGTGNAPNGSVCQQSIGAFRARDPREITPSSQSGASLLFTDVPSLDQPQLEDGCPEDHSHHHFKEYRKVSRRTPCLLLSNIMPKITGSWAPAFQGLSLSMSTINGALTLFGPSLAPTMSKISGAWALPCSMLTLTVSKKSSHFLPPSMPPEMDAIHSQRVQAVPCSMLTLTMSKITITGNCVQHTKCGGISYE